MRWLQISQQMKSVPRWLTTLAGSYLTVMAGCCRCSSWVFYYLGRGRCKLSPPIQSVCLKFYSLCDIQPKCGLLLSQLGKKYKYINYSSISLVYMNGHSSITTYNWIVYNPTQSQRCCLSASFPTPLASPLHILSPFFSACSLLLNGNEVQS